MSDEVVEIPKKDNLLLPFCIYYFEDTNTGTIYSHLGAPELMVDEGGKNPRYRCMRNSLLYRGWKPYGMFYGLDPQFRPIPRGMVLLCARWRRGFPFNTFEIRHVIDPYNLETDLYSGCMYFFAYAHKVPNTVPLYFFTAKTAINGGNILLPTFDKDNLPQPGKNNGTIIVWYPAPIPVVYVIAPDKTSKDCKKCLSHEEIQNINFSNMNNSCIPDPNGQYDNIGECVVASDSGQNTNFLQMVKEDSNNDTGIYKVFKNIPDYGISIILAIFVSSLLIIVLTGVTQNLK